MTCPRYDFHIHTKYLRCANLENSDCSERYVEECLVAHEIAVRGVRGTRPGRP